MKKLIAGLAVAIVGAAGFAALPASARQPAPAPTIVDVALAANSSGATAGLFDTLIAAATCPSLDGAIVNALSVRGQRTLFAPTDDAFAKLGLDASNVCTKVPGPALADILSYHVANGSRDAASVLDSSQIRMLNGDFVTQAGGVLNPSTDQAQIIAKNIFASNGVIHVIDSVLIPPAS